MISLDVKWSEPYTFRTEYGEWWKRDWLIPIEHRSEFFIYWRSNSFKLKDKGYGVAKKNEEWYLTESKPVKHHFKEFSHLAPDKTVEDNFKLTPFEVKDQSGLRLWQVSAVSKICAAIKHWGCAIDGSDLGVGKTYTACGVARELDMDILIVCPKAVKESWRRVIKNHFKMAGKLVGIVNYELLTRGRSDSDIASFIKNKKTHINEFIWKIPKTTLIVWDESQKLKGSKTKNSVVCLKALEQGYKMLFCSATNATNPLELRTVGMSLKLFGNNKQYYQWLYQHGVSKGRFGFQFNNSKSVLSKLNKDIFVDRGVRLSRDNIPNFPESQIIAECYDMEDESRCKINDVYKEMEVELNKLKNKIKKTDKDRINHLTIIMREREKIELLKVPLFIEMIEEGIENGMSVVVFMNFTKSLNAIADRLNIKCIFDGKTSQLDRQNNVDNFQNDKERVILVNIQSGGAGLSLGDMTGKYPRLSIISPSYSAINMRQSLGRVWRESSKTKSIQKIVFVSGTVEEKVCEGVNLKLTNLDTINDGDLSIN